MMAVSHALALFSLFLCPPLLGPHTSEVLSLSMLTKECQGKKLEGQGIVSSRIILMYVPLSLLFLNFLLCWQLLERKVPTPFEDI